MLSASDAVRKAPADPGLCEDSHPRCEAWAKAGECTKNAPFMVGGRGSYIGACRAVCKVCKPCTEVGSECWIENRKVGGWFIYDPKTV